MSADELYMRRCFELAERGIATVSPNPMVGAVLVCDGRILGEGWHQTYGQAHAEVNCLAAVLPADRPLIPRATLYCSLEPCSHTGKTPPCADLVLREHIPRVLVSNLDPNPLVAGQGIARLREGGVQVSTGLLEDEGAWLNRVFFHRMREKRPYIVLKWAESNDAYLGRVGERTTISSAEATRLVHRWRGGLDAILVGTRTAILDNPRLDTRLFSGKNPLRIAIDKHQQIPPSHHLLDDSLPTWIIGPTRPGTWKKTRFYDQPNTTALLPQILEMLANDNRASLLVEGGAETLRTFVEAGLWDEIRRIRRTDLHLGRGVAAPPVPTDAKWVKSQQIGPDRVDWFVR
jgi:diaminohydroxyphosphoribosylaminopyrimidine deaminase / 5-amino-6-(5-phosphoribosylamino)uracil reductase